MMSLLCCSILDWLTEAHWPLLWSGVHVLEEIGLSKYTLFSSSLSLLWLSVIQEAYLKSLLLTCIICLVLHHCNECLYIGFTMKRRVIRELFHRGNR